MATKSERLEMRLTAKHKALIERAAAATGQPVTAFAVASLVGQAEAVLARHRQTVLSSRDQRVFTAILEADDEPVPALVAQAKRLR